MSSKRRLRLLPGFGLSLGYTFTYLSLIVLIPLAAVFIKTSSLGLEQFVHQARHEREIGNLGLREHGLDDLAAGLGRPPVAPVRPPGRSVSLVARLVAHGCLIRKCAAARLNRCFAHVGSYSEWGRTGVVFAGPVAY